MSRSMKNSNAITHTVFGLGTLLLLLTAMPRCSYAEAQQDVFPTPEKAVEALIFATRHEHTTELHKILGPTSGKLIHSGDDVADQEGREKFVAAYDKAHKIEDAGDDRKVLAVGDEEWPMPIPLLHDKDGWRFDTASGEMEILNRRIGRDELNVIEVCRAYVEAQREFAALHPSSDNQHEYAQNFQSTEGKHDGLYWEVKDGEKESPLGPLIASATAEGYSDTTALDKRTPYHGYYYKILKSQGEHAAGGAVDYVKDGHMTGGFALIAFPATYGDSGVMSFIVNQNGIVYETNLGPETPGLVGHITAYDPDDSWTIVQ
jgi:hypothetical protein